MNDSKNIDIFSNFIKVNKLYNITYEQLLNLNLL